MITRPRSVILTQNYVLYLSGYSYYNTVLFALLNLVLVTTFLEFWKRRSNEHAYYWGTAGKLRHKKARPEFRGDFGLNSITGEPEVSME